jgi:hypothetical protein
VEPVEVSCVWPVGLLEEGPLSSWQVPDVGLLPGLLPLVEDPEVLLPVEDDPCKLPEPVLPWLPVPVVDVEGGGWW